MKIEKFPLVAYVNSLQATGRYSFTRTEALAVLGGSSDAFRFAALRLIKKKRLLRPKQGFYVIVPTEYSQTGVLPATWFIDALMKFYRQPYYVGLLSAAALYGAAHQQPQVFQVITSKPMRSITIGGSQLQFFTKTKIKPAHCQPLKTPTGYMQVSFPEVTVLDLVHYSKSAGHLNHVATILSELYESLDAKRLAQLLETTDVELPDIQRLGYLLQLVETNVEILTLLKQWLKKRKLRSVPLCADKAYEKKQKNPDWHIYVNEKIEIDI